MEKTKRFGTSFFLIVSALVLCCSSNRNSVEAGQDAGKISLTIPTDPGGTQDAALVPNSKNTQTLNAPSPIIIVFNKGSAPSISRGANATAAANGNHIRVNLTASGANIAVQGICADGSLTFSGDYDFNLYLNGVGLTNPAGAAINNEGSGVMNVTLVDGTANRLIDGARGSQKAAFYSNGGFSITGGGQIEVRGKTAHAIAAKGAFSQMGGTILVKESVKDGVNAKTAAISGGFFTARTDGDGIQGDDGLTITGGTFSIITSAVGQKSHGIKSDGDIIIGTRGGGAPVMSIPVMNITVYGSGSKGISADGSVTIHSGRFALNTAGNGFWDIGSTENDKTSGCAGIKCDGDLLINGGTFTMLSTGTGGKGINVDGNLTISGGDFTIITTGQTYAYNALYDSKPKAVKSDGNLTINDGTFIIKTFTPDAEGLESKNILTINGGTIEIDAYDDGINAENHIQINGGKIYCSSASNDGIDSNGTLTITGGTVVSLGTSGHEEGFDCDRNTFTVTGGTIIGLGGATSKPTAAATTVCTVECNMNYSGIYHIESAGGTEIMTFKMPRTYNGNVCMLFGGGGMSRGVSYTVYSGGSVSGGTDFHGLYTGAKYTKGSVEGTFTGSAYTTVGAAGGFSGRGGQPGGANRPWR